MTARALGCARPSPAASPSNPSTSISCSKEHYQILVDTLLGTMIEPCRKRQERQVISKAGKFCLFDVGVAGAITRRHIAEERGEIFGRALEHFLLMEILAHRSYRGLDYAVHFRRTPRVHEGIEVLPWREFLAWLWGGAILS